MFRPITLGLRTLFTAIALISPLAFGVEEPALLKDVPQMIKSGKLDDAQRIVERILAANPKHPAARFQKSVILAERGRRDDAIKVLQELSGEYPELPEPYNNLAVLYAAKGDYDNARWALTRATEADPKYGLALENLGDVYAALAEHEYKEASTLDPNDQILKTKHNSLRSLVAPIKPRAPSKPPAAQAARPDSSQPASH